MMMIAHSEELKDLEALLFAGQLFSEIKRKEIKRIVLITNDLNVINVDERLVEVLAHGLKAHLATIANTWDESRCPRKVSP